MLAAWAPQVPLHLAAVTGIVLVIARWSRLPRAAAVLCMAGLALMSATAVLIHWYWRYWWYGLYQGLDLQGFVDLGTFGLASAVIGSLLYAVSAALVLAGLLTAARRSPARPHTPWSGTAAPQYLGPQYPPQQQPGPYRP